MKILVIAGTYPHAGHLFSGVFNEKCALALSSLCEGIRCEPPCPYVPPGFSMFPRCRSYGLISRYELRNGVAIYRPATLVIPKIGAAVWADFAPFLGCISAARRLHRDISFDAIVSFDLVQAGGIAWRLGRCLGIPATGWAFGSDVRHPKDSALGGVAARAIEKLDVVFYQSRELLEKAASLLSTSPTKMTGGRHVVLPHGIPEPPAIPRAELRNRVREELGIEKNQILLVYTGRIVREKGVFELLDAASIAAKRNARITCVMVGSNPSYDQTNMVQQKISGMPTLKKHVRLLPACAPNKIWEYLCAAGFFVFPSHNEGVPNSLLEAMAMGLPAVAFDIPGVSEINDVGDALVTVPFLDVRQFSEAIIRLAESPEYRRRIGEAAKKRISQRYLVRTNMAEALSLLSQVISDRESAKQREQVSQRKVQSNI